MPEDVEIGDMAEEMEHERHLRRREILNHLQFNTMEEKAKKNRNVLLDG